MKKKLLLLLATTLFITVITGCGSAEDTETNEPVSEETEIEETSSEFSYSVQAYGLDNALLRITSIDDAGETIVEETGSYGWFGAPGGTLAQIMDEWNVESVEPICDEFDFLGWSAYTMTGEDFEEAPLYDGKIFTTDEMLALELPECDVYFYTEWKMTCGGCEEQKICDVHYIDDERYIVCDDCYEEFATGMGLLE